MDPGDDRLFFPSSSIMNDMSHQGNYLPTLDDPNSLMTYYINENEGGCQTLVSAPLSTNQLIASGGQHLSSTSIHDPNHFHSSSSASSSANSSIAQISNHYPRSQHSLNHNHSQTHAHDSVVNGFLNNILPTDPLPQFSILQEQSRNLYNSNNLVCNTNSTNEPSSVLFETSVLQFGSINDTNINGINNLSNKELISNLNSQRCDIPPEMISNSSFRKNLNEINNNSMNSQLQKNTCNTMANKSALPNVSSYNHSSNLPLQHSMQPSPTNSRNRSQINNHNHVQPINHKSQMHANHNGWANHVTNNDTSCSTGSYFEQQPNQNRKMINPNLNPNLNPYVTNTNTHLSASPIGDVSKTNGQSKPIIASTSVDQSNLIATKSSPKLLCQDTKIMCVNDYVTDNPVFPNPSRIHRPAICPKPQEIQGQQPQVKREKSPVVSMDSHTLPESNKLKSMARVQTLISFKIVEQIILDDKVVKETVLKDENIRRNGGFIFWPEEDDERLQTSSDMIPANAIRNSTNISSITTSSNQIGFAKVSNLSCDPSPMPNTPDTPTTIEATSLDEIKPSTVNSNQSSNQFCLNHSPSTSVSVNSPNTDFNATSSLSSKMRATTTAPPTKVGSASSRPIEDVKRKEFGMYQALSPSTDAISSTCSSVTTIISSSSCSVVNTPSPNNAYPDGKKIETHSSIMNKRSYFDSDLDDVSFRPIENNCRVLAKWSDKNFYAGKIAEKINDNKWLVQFDDGGRRTVGENEIISVDHLPIGQQVMVTFATGFCVKGRVKSHRLADTTLELYYLIEHLTNSHVAESEYRASDVFLNFDHALVLLGKRKGPAHVSKFADVDLNNIIPKRARVANKSMTASSGSAGESNERSCRSSSSNNNTINFDMDLDSNSSSTSIGLLNQSADGKNERCVKSAKKRDKPNKLNGSSNKSQLKMLPGQLDFSGIGSTDIGFEVTSPTSNRKTDQLPSLFSSADQISCDLGSTSLNPSVSSNNNVALLNSATSSNHMSNTYNNEPSTPNPITSAPHTPMSAGSVHQTMQLETATEPSTPASVFESGDYKESFEIDRPEFNSSLFKSLGIVVLNCSDKVQASDNISEMTKSVQFNRDILIRLLEFGSGSIFDRVEDALANSFCKRLILIAKKHSRQVKYLQCVASGIDCLNYLWVYDCIQQNQLLDFNNYLLPTGYSILQNCLINDSYIFRKNPDLFRAVRIYLVSKNVKFVETWRPLLASANVILVDGLPQYPGSSTRKPSNCADLIISDQNLSSSIIKKSVHLKIPIVSIEYFVQCLIHGQKLSFDAHLKFSHNFKEK